MHYTFLRLLADTYNCGSYGSGAYDQGACVAPSNAAAASGPLAFTGEPWFWMVVSALVIVVISVAVLVRNKRKR